MSAEPYSPSSETRLFPNFKPGAPPARLDTRQPLLGTAPPAQLQRQGSTSSTRDAPPAYDHPNNVATTEDAKDGQPQGPQAQKIAAIREGLRETQDAMHKNIEAIQERGERMEHLQQRTDQLVVQSQTFKSTARSAHRAMWWKNMKWKIIICVALLFIIAGTIGGAVRGSEYANSH